MSLKDRILALCHQYASGGRVRYDDGGSITDPAGEIARELAAGSVPRNYKRLRANEAMAGRELSPYFESRVADYLAREDEIKARRMEAFDERANAEAAARGVTGALSSVGILPQMPTPYDEWVAQNEARITERDQAGRTALGDFATKDLPETAIAASIPFVGRAMRGSPALTGAVAGGASFLMPSSAGSAESKEQIANRQSMLKEAGFYKGDIDGVDGPDTKAAQRAYDTSAVARERQALERLKIEAEGSKGVAETKKAEAALKETERLAQEAADAKERRRLGDERLRKAEEDVSPINRLLRDYGPMAGYAAGLGMGYLSKKAVIKGSDTLSANAATRANKLVEPQTGAGAAKDLPQRAADVNQFWAEGQPGVFRSRTLPFEVQTSAPGFKATTGTVTPSGDLYTPTMMSRARNFGTDLGVAGMYGTEVAAVEGLLKPDIHKELESARAAVKEDPSEANINRLQAALNSSAAADFASNLGRMGGITHLSAGMKMQRTPSRPDVSKAEAERMRINEILDKKYGPGSSSKGGPSSTPPPPLPPTPPPTAPNGSTNGAGTLPQSQPSAGPSTPTQTATVGDPSKAPRLSGPVKGYIETPYGYRHEGSQRWAGWNPSSGTKKAPQSKAPKSKPADDDTGSELTKSKQPKRFLEADEVPKKPDRIPTDQDPGFRARGGRVLDLARKYADGGVVINHGLMGGSTPGRGDHLDVNVANGCFVVPSDCVAGAPNAGNNTRAGAEWWASVLPKPETSSMSNGGGVGIKISDGEFVVAPDQVMALGGGSMEQGHRILEAMVKKIRQQNIAHLSSLPPPARS